MRVERNWHSGFGLNSAGQAVHVADRLSYDRRRKAAILIALLDPRAPKNWRRYGRWWRVPGCREVGDGEGKIKEAAHLCAKPRARLAF